MWLKQSTAFTFRLGPFVDDTDGKTAETALTLSQADFRLSKAGGAFAQKNETTSGAHDENGYYTCILNTTDTNTLGTLDINVSESGALPVFKSFMVVPAQVWDSYFGADLLDVSVVQNAGNAITSASGIQEVKVASLAANAITATSIAADAITDAKVASDVTIASVTGAVGSVTGAVGSVATGGITTASFAAGAVNAAAIGADAITAAKIANGAIDAATFAAGAIDAAALAADAGTEIGTAVWATTARVLTANTNLNDPTSAAIADAVWDELIAGHLGAGSTGLALNSAGSAGDPWTTALPGAYGAGTAGKIVGDNINATISSRASQITLDTLDDLVDTEITDIRNRLPAALVSGRMDASVGAMAANVLTAAAAAADLTTELQTGLATSASIAALNNLSAAQVNAEVVDALNVDTYAEPGQGAPAATLSLAGKIGYLMKAWRNKHAQTSSTYSLYADDATTVDQKAAVADDGTTFSRAEIASGP